MADGSYERRFPREAELARFRRIMADAAAHRAEKYDKISNISKNKEGKNVSDRIHA